MKETMPSMTLSDGKWYAVSPDSVIWGMTEMAILEKADVLDNPSAAGKTINTAHNTLLIFYFNILLFLAKLCTSFTPNERHYRAIGGNL